MSTLVTRARALPRAVIGTTLGAARLPLDMAAKVSGQSGNEEWPPALAFATAEATVDTVLGALLRDGELVSRGRLQQARVAKLKEAAQLEAVADVERVEARTRLEEQRQANERKREQVEEQAERREQQVEQEAEQRRQQVAQAAATRKQSVREQAQATEATIDKQERNARLAAMTAETQALDAEREALEAKETVAATDATLEGAREERRSG
jgi:hypothetical protein